MAVYLFQKTMFLSLKKYNLDKEGIEFFRGFSKEDKIKIKAFFEEKLFNIIGSKKKYRISNYHNWFKKEKIQHEKIMTAKNRHCVPPKYIKNIFFSKEKPFYKNLKKKIGSFKLHDEGIGWLSFRLIRPYKFNDGYDLSKKVWGPGGELFSVIFSISPSSKYNSVGFVVGSHKKKYKSKIDNKSKFCKSEYRFDGNIKNLKITRFKIRSSNCAIFDPKLLHCEKPDIKSNLTRFSAEIRFRKND